MRMNRCSEGLHQYSEGIKEVKIFCYISDIWSKKKLEKYFDEAYDQRAPPAAIQ